MLYHILRIIDAAHPIPNFISYSSNYWCGTSDTKFYIIFFELLMRHIRYQILYHILRIIDAAHPIPNFISYSSKFTRWTVITAINLFMLFSAPQYWFYWFESTKYFGSVFRLTANRHSSGPSLLCTFVAAVTFTSAQPLLLHSKFCLDSIPDFLWADLRIFSCKLPLYS